MLLLYLTSVIEQNSDTDNGRLETAIFAAADGDADALGIIYDEVSSSVYGYALTLLRNTHDAEDVLHECFIAIWNSAGSYTSEGKPMAWIMTITRNLCYMRLRSSKRSAYTSLEDALKVLDGATGISVEDKLILKECLAELSDDECEIVLLHTLAGFRHREIAEMLKMPLATVLSKYSRAVKKLKKTLTQGG